jgi:hypothetical protein
MKWINLIGASLMLVGLSCTTGTDGEEGVPHDQSSVLGALLLFVDVWNSGDVDTYENLLDDNFTFYFDPGDVDYGLPESWGYVAEMEAYENLFDAVGAENVDVTLDLSGVTEPGDGTDTCLVEEVPYQVYVIVSYGEYDVTYIARGNLDMGLTRADGGWIITKWWDWDTDGLLGEHTTWGAIKAAF